VNIHRDLARARPEAFTPDLATSLNNLANCLSALGRREEALAAAQEVVNIHRDLALCERVRIAFDVGKLRR
jgi:tetratricopeptide (TPR) repeat protein